MGCTQSAGGKTQLRHEGRPSGNIKTDVSPEVPPPQNNGPSSVPQPKPRTQQKIGGLTLREIMQKRRVLKSYLDEGDFSSVPNYQPFKFDPIVTQ